MPAPAPKPVEVPKPAVVEPPKPAAATPAKPVEPAKPAEPAKPPTDLAKPTGDLAPGEADPTAKFHLAHDLRKELRRVMKLASRVPELETKLAEASRAPKPAPEAEQQAKALTGEVESLRKRVADQEQELRYLEYTKSDEYREKYFEPLHAALTDAYSEVSEMNVALADGNFRQANNGDFDRVLESPNQDVRKLARELFGEDAETVLALRRKIIEKRREGVRAAENYRKLGEERDRQRVSQTAEQRAAASRYWETANAELTKRYPDFFGEAEGDEEGNAALKKGYEVVDAANDPNLKLEDRIARQAAIRQRAAAFGREVVRRKRLEARVAELEKVLADIEASAPGEGKPGGQGANGNGHALPEGYRKPDDELDEIERNSTAD